MVKIMETNNLSYYNFKNINLSFEKSMFYSIVGGNKCGKTTLFRLLTGIVPTNNMVVCSKIVLNQKNICDYIRTIGIVERVNEKSFIYQKVIDEMMFPLCNLGYTKTKCNHRIKSVLDAFDLVNIYNKNINELDYQEKQILLIMLSLLHKPKVLLLDNVLDIFPSEKKEKLFNILKEFIQNEKLTIINFSSNLDVAVKSNRVIVLSNFQIIDNCPPSKIYDDDKLFYQNDLELPQITDLSIKLAMYGLINKNYFDVKEMVNDIWP